MGMGKGERFEVEIGNWLSECGFRVYRRPKVRFKSHDMFGGDVLWLLEGEVVVIQCKKAGDMRTAGYQGRAAIRRNVGVGRVNRFLTICAGRSRHEVLVQHSDSRVSEVCALMLMTVLESRGIVCHRQVIKGKWERVNGTHPNA